MVAGPQLDSLVARNVFGYAVIIDTHTGEQYIMGKDHEKIDVPKYSSDVEIAYQVTEQLHKMGWHLNASSVNQNGINGFLALFLKQDGRGYLPSFAEDLAVAICMAGVAACTGQNIAR
jgi:hypothetical protein